MNDRSQFHQGLLLTGRLFSFGLRRERPANNPIRNSNFEMIIALEARDPLAAYLPKFDAGSNMNLLLGLAAWTFNSHYNNSVRRQFLGLRFHHTTHGSPLLAVQFWTCCMWSILDI
jgi:hypothetical protein